MEDRSLALLMALHARLGHNSQLRLLDDNSLSLVRYARVCVFDFMSVCMLHLMCVCMLHFFPRASPRRASAPQWRWRPSFDASDLPGAPCVSAWSGAQRSMLSGSGCCLSCAPPWGIKKRNVWRDTTPGQSGRTAVKSSHQTRSLTTPTQEPVLGYHAPSHKCITSGMESRDQFRERERERERVSYWP